MREVAKKFMTLFAGNERVHGIYTVPRGAQAKDGEKLKGTARTLTEPYTVDNWIQHLTGKTRLGIVPITPENKVNWACIDIDRYDVDYSHVIEKVKDTPLVPIPSKSGGLHLWVFFKAPVLAAGVRKRLAAIAKKIGFGGVEIFPKQDQIITERGDVGNWVNMPYCGDIPDRRAYIDGERIALEDFPDRAEPKKTTLKALDAVAVSSPSLESGDLPEGPPCLQFLTKFGFPKGSRNNGLFNLAVYFKKAFPDSWEEKVDEANKKYMNPGSAREVMTIINSLKRKTYGYKCTDEPICTHCDKDVCMSRKFGIDGDPIDLPVLTSLTKILSDPPAYFINIDGKRAGPMCSEDFLQQSRFRKVIFERTNKVIPAIKPHKWNDILEGLTEEIQEVDIPLEATPKGWLLDYLERWLEGPLVTDRREDLLIGKIWAKNDKMHFQMADFLSYLEKQGFRMPTPQVLAHLKSSGVKHKQMKIKGYGRNIWIVTKKEVEGRLGPIKIVEDMF